MKWCLWSLDSTPKRCLRWCGAIWGQGPGCRALPATLFAFRIFQVFQVTKPADFTHEWYGSCNCFNDLQGNQTRKWRHWIWMFTVTTVTTTCSGCIDWGLANDSSDRNKETSTRSIGMMLWCTKRSDAQRYWRPPWSSRQEWWWQWVRVVMMILMTTLMSTLMATMMTTATVIPWWWFWERMFFEYSMLWDWGGLTTTVIDVCFWSCGILIIVSRHRPTIANRSLSLLHLPQPTNYCHWPTAKASKRKDFFAVDWPWDVWALPTGTWWRELTFLPTLDLVSTSIYVSIVYRPQTVDRIDPDTPDTKLFHGDAADALG